MTKYKSDEGKCSHCGGKTSIICLMDDFSGTWTCNKCRRTTEGRNVMPSPQKKGRLYETKNLDEGEIAIPLSGAGLLKEDTKDEEYLTQRKLTTKNSYSIKLEDLQKLERNATMVNRTPKFRLAFEVNGTLHEYVILQNKTFERLNSVF